MKESIGEAVEKIKKMGEELYEREKSILDKMWEMFEHDLSHLIN